MKQELGNNRAYPENNMAGIKVPRRRISVWAGGSVIVGLIAFFICCYPVYVWVLGAIGVASGIFALWQIGRSKGLVRGYRYAIAGIVISAAYLALTGYKVVNQKNEHEYAYRMYCQTNLSGLNKALKLYAKENGHRYPDAEKWCDLLMRSGFVEERQFACKGNSGHRCSYAINPNCQPNSPDEVVLLFETDGGWNKFGERELLGISSHKGKGGHILLNNSYAGFVRKENFASLKWK
ncbi:MAG: DUF4190 domain-containing protein [Planctomycetota bacterium]|jgi:hypothetical protein